MDDKYILRDENGISRMSISEGLVGILMSPLKGTAREANYEDGKRNIFVIDEDMKFGDINTQGFEVFLWKGDRIVFPKNSIKNKARKSF